MNFFYYTRFSLTSIVLSNLTFVQKYAIQILKNILKTDASSFNQSAKKVEYRNRTHGWLLIICGIYITEIGDILTRCEDYEGP